jgi:hypothetical protein
VTLQAFNFDVMPGVKWERTLCFLRF